MELKINNAEQVSGILNRLAESGKNRQPLMRTLAGTMHSAVMTNFEQGGRPAWAGIRHRQGTPLSDTATLKNSIQQFSDNDRAVVGTNLIYAPLHQFGGVIRPKKGKYLIFNIGERWVMTDKVKIPARPFLTLDNQDHEDLIDDVQRFWQSLVA